MVFKKKVKEFNCPSCNEVVRDPYNATFCQKCGFELAQPQKINKTEDYIDPPQEEIEEQPDSQQKTTSVPLDIVICPVCQGSGYYGIAQQKTTKKS